MIHTSELLKAQDGDYENWHYQLEDGAEYLLTESEMGWLDFVKGRYGIYDHIIQNSKPTANGLVYTIDTHDLSQVLYDDGIEGKAVCLSDETTLQSIFFYSSVGLDTYE